MTDDDAAVPIPRRVRGGPTPGYSPTLFLYEHTPGGIGLAERIFAERELLLARALRLVEGCPCASGCPGCVGPAIDATVGADGVLPVPPQHAKAKHATGRKAVSAELMRRALGGVRALGVG